MRILSDPEEALPILKTEKHQLEGCVTSAETERDEHELEERVSRAETEEDGTRLALEKERADLSDA